ncbi:hypothetical protein ACFTS5_14495 [Nocardia sp. NPDC056952]|uniref:hypothetical protein n=1 Tax=Nocardia sp. NPDC056952 TaxID=3345979 RepID=UPI003643A7DA
MADSEEFSQSVQDIEGDVWPGALLAAVLRLPEERWSDSAEVLAEVRGIAQRAEVMIAEMDGAQVSELRGLVLKFLSDRSEVYPGRTQPTRA